MKQVFEFQSNIQERQIFKEYCLRNDLATYDPYDIWKTDIGVRIKNLFNISRLLGATPGLVLTLYDQLLNNRFRFGCTKAGIPYCKRISNTIYFEPNTGRE